MTTIFPTWPFPIMACCLIGSSGIAVAILNTIVVGLVARQGRTHLAEARREFAA